VGSWYLDAHAGVAAYPATLETHFCLGSRLLDFVWAGLPVVVSGDELQRQFVEGNGVGYVVPPENPEALGDGIRRIRADVERRAISASAFETVRDKLRWSVVTRPIVEYCQSDAARSRRKTRNTLVGALQLAEFYARSVACRASASRLRRRARNDLRQASTA